MIIVFYILYSCQQLKNIAVNIINIPVIWNTMKTCHFNYSTEYIMFYINTFGEKCGGKKYLNNLNLKFLNMLKVM